MFPVQNSKARQNNTSEFVDADAPVICVFSSR